VGRPEENKFLEDVGLDRRILILQICKEYNGKV
jgi:hypothetical protein